MATHAACWRTSTSDGPHEAVHTLDPREVEALRARTTGTLIQSAIAMEVTNDDSPLPDTHPLRRLAAEYRLRNQASR